jgi:hypothetical protein
MKNHHQQQQKPDHLRFIFIGIWLGKKSRNLILYTKKENIVW